MMRRTPQEFKREEVKHLFDKVLQSQKIKLEPLTVSVGETWKSDFTSVELSYMLKKSESTKVFQAQESEAKGFVDGIFRACYKTLANDCPSLANIKLHDYQVRPNFNKTLTTLGSDAKVQVNVMMEVKDHGIAEFSSISRSVLHSSFATILEAFQFYINCERAFQKIQLILQDATQRNRGDIIQTCLTDLSRLTEVNTYEK